MYTDFKNSFTVRFLRKFCTHILSRLSILL